MIERIVNTKTGRWLEVETDHGTITVSLDYEGPFKIVAGDGRVVGTGTFTVPPEVEEERRRLKQGGCCGQPTE